MKSLLLQILSTVTGLCFLMLYPATLFFFFTQQWLPTLLCAIPLAIVTYGMSDKDHVCRYSELD